jgi:hypothetical protein
VRAGTAAARHTGQVATIQQSSPPVPPAPMLATAAAVPTGDGWYYEAKWAAMAFGGSSIRFARPNTVRRCATAISSTTAWLLPSLYEASHDDPSVTRQPSPYAWGCKPHPGCCR